MTNIMNSIYDMHLLDDMARKKTAIHKIHPLIKLLTTVVYLTVVVSFGKYELGSLLPLFFYPVMVFALAELPVKPILFKIMFTLPLIIGIGILNPLFDHQVFYLGGMAISKGWVTFLAIFIKCVLTVTAALLLISTTGMDRLALALRLLKIPRLFVLQLLLTYRYIALLLEEVSRMLRAYSLRAPGQKGVHRKAWGPLMGQLILRTYDRAQRVYQGMCLRGFTGEYFTGDCESIKIRDITYLAVWVSFFAIAKMYNIPMLLGSLLTGVVK